MLRIFLIWFTGLEPAVQLVSSTAETLPWIWEPFSASTSFRKPCISMLNKMVVLAVGTTTVDNSKQKLGIKGKWVILVLKVCKKTETSAAMYLFSVFLCTRKFKIKCLKHMPFCLIITGKAPEGYMISGLFF